MKQKDDQLWKGVIEEVFEDFLCFFHPEAAKVFDFSRGAMFLDRELEQLFPPENGEFTPKVVDKLARVYTHDGSEEWVLIHIEVQGDYRKDFSRRMLTYYYRILDKYNKRISAYAILTEANKKPRPNVYQAEFMGTSIQYKFNMYKIADQEDDKLLASNNPFALVVLAARAVLLGKSLKNKKERDEVLLQAKIQLVRELVSRDIGKEKIRGLMNFLLYYVRFENPEVNNIFEKEVKKLTKSSDTMGIEEFLLDRARNEGIAEGVTKGITKEKTTFARNLLLSTDFSVKRIAELVGATEAFVKKVKAGLNKRASL